MVIRPKVARALRPQVAVVELKRDEGLGFTVQSFFCYRTARGKECERPGGMGCRRGARRLCTGGLCERPLFWSLLGRSFSAQRLPSFQAGKPFIQGARWRLEPTGSRSVRRRASGAAWLVRWMPLARSR